ncbi:hypothetical protein CVS37_28130 [Burkholderia lata]|nr:hypothetical protein CVS37_28130 [Burkholderia lata]
MNWTFVRVGADLARDGRFSCRMRTNLPGRAASCVRRSKIKEKAGKPCGPARHGRALRKISCARSAPRARPAR